MSRIQGKVVLVMGASSGIGKATAGKLVQHGAKVVIAARRESQLMELAESLPDAELHYQKADVSKYEDVEKVVQICESRFGRVDAIFNNAGIMPTAPLAECRRDEWRQMLDISIMGVLHGIAAVLPIMIRQSSGHILTTDSVAGHLVYPESAVYCGTKFAVRAIMDGLRQEQLENNIKSTIISPGAVRTDLYKTISNKESAEALHKQQNTIGLNPEDVADAVVYALDTADHVSVSEVLLRPTKQQL